MKNGENSWKPKQACGAPRIDLELSWSEARRSLQDSRLSGAVAYILLNNTMYTTTRRMQALWGEPWTARSVFVDGNEVVPFRGDVKDLWLLAKQCTVTQ